MTAQDEAFIQAIREAPDDDAPRLIYADWLREQDDPVQEARGEFIQLQCELARMAVDHPARAELTASKDQLLSRYWKAWLEPLRQAVGAGADGLGWLPNVYSRDRVAGLFRRGFLEQIHLDAPTFTAAAPRLFRLTPVRWLLVTKAGAHAAALSQCPCLEEIEALWFTDYYSDPIDAAGAAALARSPYLGRLRSLYLYKNNIGDEGLEALVQAPWWLQLTDVNLGDNGISDRGAWALTRYCDRPHKLRKLDFADNAFTLAAQEMLTRALPTVQINFLGRQGGVEMR
jgi:uncharacterized protein (TIGR02996 family)